MQCDGATRNYTDNVLVVCGGKQENLAFDADFSNTKHEPDRAGVDEYIEVVGATLIC